LYFLRWGEVIGGDEKLPKLLELLGPGLLKLLLLQGLYVLRWGVAGDEKPPKLLVLLGPRDAKLSRVRMLLLL